MKNRISVIIPCYNEQDTLREVTSSVLAFALVRELVRNPRSRFLWAMLVLSAFFLSRWFLAWHGLCSFAGWRFPMSEYAFRCVDSLNSTVSLVLAAAFCVWKSRNVTVGSAAC